MSLFRALGALTALQGAASVAFGAFAAHAADSEQARALFETGAHYQGVHALAALAGLFLCQQGARGGATALVLFNIGALLFAGSLYAMAFEAPRWIAFVTPVGGVGFIAGWLALAFALSGLGRSS